MEHGVWFAECLHKNVAVSKTKKVFNALICHAAEPLKVFQVPRGKLLYRKGITFKWGVTLFKAN